MKHSLLIGTITTGLLTMAVTTQPASAQGATTGTTGQTQSETQEPRNTTGTGGTTGVESTTGAGATGTSTAPAPGRDATYSQERDASQQRQQQTAQEQAKQQQEQAKQQQPDQAKQQQAETDTAWMQKLDPQMKAVIDEIRNSDAKPLHTLSAEDARKQPSIAEAAKKVAERQDKKLAEVAKTHDVDIKLTDVDLKGRVYQPEGDGPFPVILYVHGGGWVVGSLDSYEATPRALCKATNALVIATTYRQAPEHKFPTAHNDVFGAYQWAMENAGRWSGNGKQVAIVGESAGGNMAAAATVMAQDKGMQMPVHQVLIYPVANTTMDTESYREYENAKPLDAATMKWFFSQALANPADAKDSKIALLESKSFKGLPPVTIITAEIDPLKSEGEALAKKYEQDGVKVTYKNFEGVTHEFFGMTHAIDKAQEAVDLVANQLKQSFGAGGQPAAGASASRTGGQDAGTGIDTGTGTATGGSGAGGPAAGGPGSERAGTGGAGSGGTTAGGVRGTGSGTAADTGALGAGGQTEADRAADRAATDRAATGTTGSDRAASGGTDTGTEGRTGTGDRTGSGTVDPDRSGGSEVEIDR